MAWDIGFTAGLTDEGVDGALASMGRRIKENTHEIRTFAQGLNSATRLVTGLAGGFGVVAVYQTLAGLADQMFFAAKREADERRRGRIEAEATFAASFRSFRMDVIDDPNMRSAKGIRDRIAQLKEEAAAAAGNPLQSFQRGQITLQEYTKAQRDLEEDLKNIDYWGQRMLENSEKQVALRKAEDRAARDQFTTELEIAAAAASGLDIDSQRMAESERHAENLKKIEEFREQDFWLAEKQMQLEETRHAGVMKNLAAEEQARKEAAAAQLAAEVERMDQQLRSAEMLEKQLEIERLRLSGLKDQAEEAERRLKHEQNIQRIMELQGITDDQRMGLLEAERANFALRGGTTQATETAMGRTRSAGQGFINFGALSRLTLGGGSSNPLVKPVVEEQRKTNTKLDQLINSVKGMAGGAVYA